MAWPQQTSAVSMCCLFQYVRQYCGGSGMRKTYDLPLDLSKTTEDDLQIVVTCDWVQLTDEQNVLGRCHFCVGQVAHNLQDCGLCMGLPAPFTLFDLHCRQSPCFVQVLIWCDPSILTQMVELQGLKLCVPLCVCVSPWHLLTYVLTPWSRVLLEKLTGFQLVKKFPAFYGTWRFISAVTSARHLSLLWASSIQSMTPHPTSWRSTTSDTNMKYLEFVQDQRFSKESYWGFKASRMWSYVPEWVFSDF